MKGKWLVFGYLFVAAAALSACAAPAAGNQGGAAPAATATMVKEMPKEDQMKATPEKMDDKAMATPEKMDDKAMATPEKMDDKAMATPEKMDDKAMSTPEKMDDKAMATPEKMDDKAAMAPWFSAALTDVRTGETFAVADFKGKVALVETIAIWCPTCLRQQREVAKVKEALGMREDLISVTLDIDPNESAADLKAYAEKHGFGGRYAVAGAEVARDIATLYGDQFINPPSAPMLVIDRQGKAHALPFGLKDAAALQAALEPFRAAGM